MAMIRKFTPSRRIALTSLAAAGLACTLPFAAFSQRLPARPYKIIVGSPPGALGDVLARLMAQKLSEASGQPAVVDNRPGAAGAIAAEAVAKSPADGSTLLLAPDAVMVVNPFVYPKLAYDPARDFQSVGLLGKASLVLLVSPALKVKTFAEFVRLAKAQPKAINYGTGGVGHPTHMVMELLCSRAGIQLTAVPYKGTTPALQGLMGGEVGAMISGMVEALPQVKAGNAIALAASGPAAKEMFPGLPEFKETSTDLDLSVWFGMFAPAATPREVVTLLNAEVNKALGQPDVQKRLADFGLAPSPVATTDLDALMRADRARFGPLVKALGLVAE
jgi:tripartite-type tricarboxylate transporter receptor subunit TctC